MHLAMKGDTRRFVREGFRIMFKPALFAVSLVCTALATSAVAAPTAPDADASAAVQYRVTVLSRDAVVFEGEGRADAGSPLELRQYVLARDNAGHGQSFVDSGIKIVLRSSQVSLDVAGQGFEAPVTVKLDDEAVAMLGGYTVKIAASAVQPKTSPVLPEDFAYLAPSLSLESLALPNVAFDRGSYQLANAVLERPVGNQASAVLVAPRNVARAANANPLLAQR